MSAPAALSGLRPDLTLVKRLIALLERIEWEGEIVWNGEAEGPCCPSCYQPRGIHETPAGHAPDCEFAACLTQLRALLKVYTDPSQPPLVRTGQEPCLDCGAAVLEFHRPGCPKFPPIGLAVIR